MLRGFQQQTLACPCIYRANPTTGVFELDPVAYHAAYAVCRPPEAQAPPIKIAQQSISAIDVRTEKQEPEENLGALSEIIKSNHRTRFSPIEIRR